MTNLSIWMANQTYHWTTVLKNILFGPCSSPNLASEKNCFMNSEWHSWWKCNVIQ